MVFNQPISGVVSATVPKPGGADLEVQGQGFQSNAVREVWMDPRFSPTNSSLIDPSQSFFIGNVRTDSNGDVPLQNLSLSSSEISRISSDGFAVHYVVIMAVNQSAAAPPYSSLAYDLQANYSASTIVPASSGIVLFVTLIEVQIPVSYTIGGIFIVLWTFFLLMFAMALNGPYNNVVGAMRRAAREGLSGIFSNSMFATLAIFTVVFWGQYVLQVLQSAGGVSTGGLPPEDPLLTLLSFTIAPFREELGFRVIPIGVVALLILLARGRIKDGLMALWHPRRYLMKNDTPLQYKRHQVIMYALIAISAFLFGLAHVVFGGGWGIGKISEAAGAGLAFGVLYYQYGLPSAVLIHWAFDYMYGVYLFSGALSALGNWFILYTILVAILSTIALFVMLSQRLRHQGPSAISTTPLQKM
jgi:hypothetical protein